MSIKAGDLVIVTGACCDGNFVQRAGAIFSALSTKVATSVCSQCGKWQENVLHVETPWANSVGQTVFKPASWLTKIDPQALEQDEATDLKVPA